jgi:hypothetical protein
VSGDIEGDSSEGVNQEELMSSGHFQMPYELVRDGELRQHRGCVIHVTDWSYLLDPFLSTLWMFAGMASRPDSVTAI